MKKLEVLKKIIDVGVVAVIRGDNIEQAVNKSKACAEGGIPALEVTYTVPGATEVIKELKKSIPSDKLLVGAGSVIDAQTAGVAILAGAEYIVSPAFNLDTAKFCNRYQVPYMAGCLTPTEMLTALEAGVDIVKLFPGSVFGPSYVKAIKVPLPQLNIMPTGGVSVDNAVEWIKAGVVAVGAGASLTSGSFQDIVEKSKEFVARIKQAREEVKQSDE